MAHTKNRVLFSDEKRNWLLSREEAWSCEGLTLGLWGRPALGQWEMGGCQGWAGAGTGGAQRMLRAG